MNPAAISHPSRFEWPAVAMVTTIGALLRLWPIGRLGLTHFDEGIYAMVASWSLQPRGLASIDPLLIPYAPPGYPILGGLGYAILGRADGAIISISQVAGTMTIPVVAWLARRTFGPCSGFMAAVFCAFSGPHIAFSRMALTDSAFLLAFLLALGAGMRFLEKPGVWRAIVMGLAVGLTQEFKYNGWLAGGIVAASAVLVSIVRTENWTLGALIRTFAWGCLAVGIAWSVVWPWFHFVEDHGGYSALLRHQNGYLGGWRSWWPNLRIQAEQSIALSDFRLVGACLVITSLTVRLVRPPSGIVATNGLTSIGLAAIPVVFGCITCLFILTPYWLGLAMVPWLFSHSRPSVRLVGIWWAVLSILTPFYHPYARLWLPYHAVNWLLMGCFTANGMVMLCTIMPVSGIIESERARYRSLFFPRYWACIVLAVIGSMIFLASWMRHPSPQSDLFAPSDSVFHASMQVTAILPDEIQGLRVLVRPSVTFYLAGRIPLFPTPGSEQLLTRGDPRLWALVDAAILRSEAGRPSVGPGRHLLDPYLENWEVAVEIPTTLSLPTALDLDPGVALGNMPTRSCPLWLLRPRRSGIPK